MDDPRLARFGQFTPEGSLTPGYNDHYLFFAGRDDVHGILLSLIVHETMCLKMNMFGYADNELNKAIMTLMENPNVQVQGTLDKYQAGGAHERVILAHDAADNPDFYNSFVVTTSATSQISHTKGGVLVSQGFGWEGSVNWSASGEGTGIRLDPAVKPVPGFAAQNNTLLVSANHVFVSRFSARLDAEHLTGLARRRKAGELAIYPVPTVSDLAVFSGRDEATYTSYANAALLQSTIRFTFLTEVTDPASFTGYNALSAGDQQVLALNGICSLADSIYLQFPYQGVAASPLNSETIGTWTYTKNVQVGAGSRALQAGAIELSMGTSGVVLFDMAVQLLSLRTIASGVFHDGVSVFDSGERRGALVAIMIYEHGDGRRSVLGPEDQDLVNFPFDLNGESFPAL